jgi:hypothetical protein
MVRGIGEFNGAVCKMCLKMTTISGEDAIFGVISRIIMVCQWIGGVGPRVRPAARGKLPASPSLSR